MPRPDLSKTSPEIIAYIEELEAELDRLQSKGKRDETPAVPLEPDEPVTTRQVITLTTAGIGKRTPRHLYSRQRRGGMGIFDLDTPESDPPAILAIADLANSLLVFTDQARAFRLPVEGILEGSVHSRGQSIFGKINLLPGEKVAALLADEARGSVALASQSGWVRLLRHHVFGEYMKQGTSMFDPQRYGPLVAACRTVTNMTGAGDLLVVTRGGIGIRFPEKTIPPTGAPGIRLQSGDAVVGIAGVDDNSRVFIATSEGRGTIRIMSGFNPNKTAGGGGKIIINASDTIGIVPVENSTDLFLISRLGKMIRFTASEVPEKEGTVQGVNCMALRGDEVTALAASYKE